MEAEIEKCFEELLRVLPELAGMESVTERLSEVIGTLEMLLPRLTYRQGLKDGEGVVADRIKNTLSYFNDYFEKQKGLNLLCRI